MNINETNTEKNMNKTKNAIIFFKFVLNLIYFIVLVVVIFTTCNTLKGLIILINKYLK